MIFISHASADALLAAEIATELERLRINCWIAPRDVTPGRPYAEECVRGIEASSAFVFLASTISMASNQVLSEIEQAHKRRIPIYTVLVGKPKISKEVDYYISRLHWLEAGSEPPECLAKTLAAAIAKPREWQDVARPPSLLRTITYRPESLLPSAALAALACAAILIGGFFFLNRGLNSDYRRYGYVTISRTAPRSATIDAQVWILASNTRFKDTRLLVSARTRSGGWHSLSVPAWPSPDQVGSVENLLVRIPMDTDGIATCLDLSRVRGVRVEQRFALPSYNDEGAGSPLSDAFLSSASVSCP